MLKKLTVFIFYFLSQSTIHAGTMGPLLDCGEPFADGPYVGGSVGARLNASGASTYGAIEQTLSVGLGKLWRQWYLGGELLASDNIQVRLSGSETQNAFVKTSWTYGFDLLPGAMLNDKTLAYLRLGIIESRFPYTGAYASNTQGLQAGIGLETTIYQHLDARVEYIFTNYNEHRYVYNNTTVTWAHPYGNQFNVGAVYKFFA